MTAIGNFKWENGSINDNIIKLLRNHNIDYYHTFSGDIMADVYGIGLFKKVEYTLTNPINEVYAVYIG